jgi:proteasome activator subunit 4
LEVRETASVTLAGLVQCGFLSLEKGFLDQFFRKSITSYQTGEEKSSKALLMRHAGILGLCAYISAYPYSVAVHTPDILIILSGHINDPQPINQTVKNTIKEFRRTHLDNWSEHRSKFTEEQLIVLTDLLVSPTYYA